MASAATAAEPASLAHTATASAPASIATSAVVSGFNWLSITSCFNGKFRRKRSTPSVADPASQTADASPKDAIERLTSLLERILRESKRPAEMLESLKAANTESRIEGGGRLVNLMTEAGHLVMSDDGQKRISDALDEISKLEGVDSKDPFSRPVQVAIDGIGN
ncbi:hypothetical protein HK405_008847, partial [Cladochytrium tenue]